MAEALELTPPDVEEISTALGKVCNADKEYPTYWNKFLENHFASVPWHVDDGFLLQQVCHFANGIMIEKEKAIRADFRQDNWTVVAWYRVSG